VPQVQPRREIVPPQVRPRRDVEPPRRSPREAPTMHPEPLTDIAAAERTGSWPPIDHESARALDRGGTSPWDALDEDAKLAEASAPEVDTVKRAVPTASRFGGEAGGGGRFGPGPRERPSSLFDDDGPAAPVDKRALLDGLPVAGRRPEQKPAEPKPVEDTGGGGRLTRAQRPARDGEQKTSAPGSLRAARRPRRPDR
jgi:hypothetical protein